MNDDAGMRARVAGKQEVAARTVWSLDVGVGAILRFRCLKRDDGSYVVQARTSKGWTEEVATGADPNQLLLRAARGAAGLFDESWEHLATDAAGKRPSKATR